MTPIRVLLADDHTLVRAGIRGLLDGLPGIEVTGHSTKEIAQRLGLSPRTVEAHRAQLMERLDLHDVAGLVRFAVKVGLVTPEG